MPKNTQKAIIQVLNSDYNPVTDIQCMFNPETYTITKKNKWKNPRTGGSRDNRTQGDKEGREHSDAPQLTFNGGGSQMLKVKLFFDTTENGADVRKQYTEKILKLMMIEGEEPPLCRFIWGGFVSSPSVITNLTQKFTMFLSDGTPVRAELDVTFQQQHKPAQSQNPTSIGTAKRTWVVRGGDRLDLIAFQELGSANRWPEIAKMNDLLNPMTLKAGQILKIPVE